MPPWTKKASSCRTGTRPFWASWRAGAAMSLSSVWVVGDALLRKRWHAEA
jgi:hypothetical protein